jgi:hypothetical protein
MNWLEVSLMAGIGYMAVSLVAYSAYLTFRYFRR